MKTSKYGKLFDIRHFPMDFGRLVCNIFKIGYRTRKLDRTGNKYKKRLCGGAVIVSNHVAMLDPLAVITTFLYRRVFFFASEMLATAFFISAKSDAEIVGRMLVVPWAR